MTSAGGNPFVLAPVCVMLDCEAQRLISSGAGLEIITPAGGTLTYKIGLLSDEELTINQEQLRASVPCRGLRPVDGGEKIAEGLEEYNIALAILRERETMKKVRRIYSMGTGGFGPDNASPVAEFTVYVDAEAYKTMLDSGIPITIIGFDLCLGPAALRKPELDALRSGGKCGRFVAECTSALVNYNITDLIAK